MRYRERSTESAMSRMYESMSGRIRGGEMQAGARLPSERALMEAYGINRMAVKAVMDRLVREHLIYRIQGKGSFVREEVRSNIVLNVPDGAIWFSNCTERISATTVGAGTVPAVGELKRLSREGKRDLAAMERVIAIDARPVLFERLYFWDESAIAKCGKPEKEYPYPQCGARPAAADVRIEIIKAGPPVVERLMLTEEALVFYIARWFADEVGSAVAYVEQYVRTDGVALAFDGTR